jgi:hypothetical protein
MSEDQVVELVIENWGNARPGQSENDLSRKVLVNVPPKEFYCSPKIPIQLGMNIKSELKVRQEGEDPYISNYIEEEEAFKYGFEEIEAKHVDIVCYHKSALIENNGTRSSDSDWEIVAILATDGKYEPMMPLTMARNYLDKPGGTKTEYSAKDIAESVYYWSCNKGISVKLKPDFAKDAVFKIASNYGLNYLHSRGSDSKDFKEYSIDAIRSLMFSCYYAGLKNSTL